MDTTISWSVETSLSFMSYDSAFISSFANIIQCICSECHLIYLAICKSKFSITLEMILTKAVGIKKGYDTTKDPFCFHGQLIDTFTKSLFTILQLAQQTITSNSKQHILKEVPEI
jgi:hypothetical protein